MKWVQAITLFFYGTLLLELTVWHIPSVASSVNILSKEGGLKKQYSPAFQWVFEWPLALRALLFGGPLVFIYAAHFYPFIYVFIFPAEANMAWAIPAMILVVLGRALSLAYIFTIRRDNRQKGDSFKLHTSGVYGFSRNPGLLGLYVSFLGFLTLLPHWPFALCLLVYGLHMHFKVRMEEDFLSRKFGAPYRHYLQQSKRYL